MPGKHNQVHPLTAREMEAFGRAIAPPEDPFQAWLSDKGVKLQKNTLVARQWSQVTGMVFTIKNLFFSLPIGHTIFTLKCPFET